MIQAQQNAEIDQNQREEKLQKPNEVDEGEGQVIDPDEKKEKQNRKQKKRDRKKPDKKNRGRDSGKFVDYSA